MPSEVLVMTKQNLTIIMLLAYAPLYLLVTWVTNAFIVSGVLRHWNDVPSQLHETKEERLCKTEGNLS